MGREYRESELSDGVKFAGDVQDLYGTMTARGGGEGPNALTSKPINYQSPAYVAQN